MIQHCKMSLKIKSVSHFALVLNVILLLISYHVNGQVSNIAPEWKAHFISTPTIENCVFEDDDKKSGETHLYQFRWQTNAFLFRQIPSLAEASSNHIALTDGYVGRYESNSWSIQGAGPSGQLFLFPNAGNIWGIRPKDANEMSLYMGEGELFSALYYGIFDLNPETVEWSENSKFTASSRKGEKMIGEITDVSSNGLPTRLEWHYAEARPGMDFIEEYKYDNANFGLPYFPSEFDFFTENGGEKQLADVFKILILETSSTPLEESYFDHDRYFFPPAASLHEPSTLLFTNNELFDISHGYPEKVFSASDAKLFGNVKLTAINVKLVRLFLLGFLVLSVIGLLIIWKHTNTKQ